MSLLTKSPWDLPTAARDRAMWNNLEIQNRMLEEICHRLGETQHEDRGKAYEEEEFKLELVRRILYSRPEAPGVCYGKPEVPKLLPEIEVQRNVTALRRALSNLTEAARKGTRVMAVQPRFTGICSLSGAEVEAILTGDCAFPQFAELIGQPILWIRLAKYLLKKMPALFTEERVRHALPTERF